MDSYARVKDSELWLLGMHISPYEKGNIYNHDPLRRRKLLMHSREIERLKKSTEENGFSKKVSYISQKNNVIRKSVLWDTSGAPLKELIVKKVTKVDTKNNKYRPTHLEVTNKQNGRKSSVP